MLNTFQKGGIHPPQQKIAAIEPIWPAPLPPQVIIPLSQHIGAPAEAIVKAGDQVLAGQCIATASGFVSAPVHSSVSGTVLKVDLFPTASGYRQPAVQIRVEGDEWDSAVDRSTVHVAEFDLTPEEIVARIRRAGVVGMGGATFPLHVKLSLPPEKKADLLLVNAVECEPYLTCDHRLMLERTAEIMTGIRLLMRALHVGEAVVGIEANKPNAIVSMKRAALEEDDDISIVTLQTKYPQGGEKQLIKAVTGREVPSGGLPVDVGVVPCNVATVLAVYEAVLKQKPLIERVVTITGPKLPSPSNWRARIGTPLSWLVDHSGKLPGDTGKMIVGGPMMGKAVGSLDIPVTKGTSGVVLLPRSQSVRPEPTPCIRCARCVEVCPMGLEPFLLSRLSARDRFDEAERQHVTDCIECGSCSYACPAARPLLDFIRLGKTTVLQRRRLRSQK